MAIPILVVEDEPLCMGLIVRALNRAGHTTLEATCCDQAIQRCAENEGPLRLVIADIQLPGLSGFDTALLLKAVHPDMQVLFTSGTPEEGRRLEDAALADVLPEARFLAKPFCLSALLEQVASLLDPVAPKS